MISAAPMWECAPAANYGYGYEVRVYTQVLGMKIYSRAHLGMYPERELPYVLRKMQQDLVVAVGRYALFGEKP